jgi:outer membrane protein TolC
VYRWENQIAVNRQAVIEAVAVRNITEIILNRLLNRPLEEPFVTLEEDLEDAALRDGPQLLMAYMTDPWRFRVFRNFMSQEAMLASPELRSLGAQIQAQERELTRTNRALWLPEFDLIANLRGFLADGGAGSDFTGLPGLPEDAFATADDVNWSVALRARYPLFTGTRRLAEKARATETLASLDLQREGLSQRIDERLRTSLHLLGASRANVDLSREAADAAGRNYELVRDSYSRGVETIIVLLDAQNTALLADLDAATVFYSFLIDLMRSQRAAGTFDYFASDQDREAFMQRLDAYFQSAQLDSGAP